MRQQIKEDHRVRDGNPAGGFTTGVGIDIKWQDGPLGRQPSRRTIEQIKECSTPIYHETHRYCPSCPWTEDVGSKAPNGAFVEGVIQACIGRLEFYQTTSDGIFACEENLNAIDHLHQALAELEDRTAKREAREVEGTHEP